MSNICFFTKKKKIMGNNISHAKNKTRRSFKVNIIKKKFWLEKENRFINLKISTTALRTIDKIGIEKVYDNIINKKKNRKSFYGK